MVPEKKNIIWIVPAAVRRWPSECDNLGRLKFMDAFARESVEYTNMYTAGASTFMSMMSLMTGTSAVHFASHYHIIKNHRFAVPTVYSTLAQHGYHNYFFSYYFPVREVMSAFYDVRHLMSKEDFQKCYYDCHEARQTTKFFQDFISKQPLKEPFCLFAHLGPNHYFDETFDYSKTIETIFKTLADKYALDESVCILHADQGYPAYRGENNTDFMWTHDTFLTEEKIRVPFFIKFPGCKTATKIDTASSLTDVYPTLCQLLSISHNSPFISSSQEKRFIRVDNRFIKQPGRKVALLQNHLKMIFDFDTNKSEFYSITTDSCLETSVNPPQNIIENFQEHLAKDEENGLILRKKIEDYNIASQTKVLLEIRSKAKDCLLVRLANNVIFNTRIATILSAKEADLGTGKPQVADLLIVIVRSIIMLNDETINAIRHELMPISAKKIMLLDEAYGYDLVDDMETYLKHKHDFFILRKARDERDRSERATTKEEFSQIMKSRWNKQNENSFS